MANTSTRRLGTLCRMYRNAAHYMLAIEDVEVVVNVLRIASNNNFHRSVSAINVSKEIYLLEPSDRVVDTIEVVGDFSSIETNSGNYYVPTWDAATATENDVTITLEGLVAKIGDTL